MTSDWSIKAIQNLILDREEWEKKSIYATDSEKCPCGVYYALKGEKPTTPDEPRGLRRMEVGSMIERNQINKLKSLGILVEAQRRIADAEYNVSGRHDGLVISPTECSERAKDLIERKKEIHHEISLIDKEYWGNIEKYNHKEIDRSTLHKLQHEVMDKKQDLHDEDFLINQELLIPNPENSLILMEIKSIVEMGFKWRQKDGVPMDSHKKQIMFYLWKLREIYPNIKARIIYVDTSYQDLLEFDVEYDENIIEDMKRFWKYINGCIETNQIPEPVPDIIKDTKSGKWKVNYQAEWCKYHQLCTGDPDWLGKAIKKVAELNKKK